MDNSRSLATAESQYSQLGVCYHFQSEVNLPISVWSSVCHSVRAQTSSVHTEWKQDCISYGFSQTPKMGSHTWWLPVQPKVQTRKQARKCGCPQLLTIARTFEYGHTCTNGSCGITRTLRQYIISVMQINTQTDQDPLMSRVKKFVIEGWPKGEDSKEIAPFSR